jgi:biopolymer transport protein ExbD
MNRPRMGAVLRTPDLFGWIDALAPRIIQCAARRAPVNLSVRLEEEWLADLAERRGRVSRLSLSLGCYWAALVISRDHPTVTALTSSTARANRCVTVSADYRHGFSSQRRIAAVPGAALCQINTTPLIDVMLVLLVTLIVSLPVMTHAVRLDLPRKLPDQEQLKPEVINLEIDFDGTVVWNGIPLASLRQLDSYFSVESRREPQPEVHLRPDRRAKYQAVASVLASAQRNRMHKIGFVNTADFSD